MLEHNRLSSRDLLADVYDGRHAVYLGHPVDTPSAPLLFGECLGILAGATH
jgi:hypothetical protein